MQLNLGKDYNTNTPLLIESSNINYIVSTIGQGKSTLVTNIIKELQKEDVIIEACVESNKQVSVIQKDSNTYGGITKVMLGDVEAIIFDLFYTLEERGGSGRTKFTPAVFIFDSVIENHSVLENILQTPKEVLEELNIHVIIVKQVSPIIKDKLLADVAQADLDFTVIEIKRNGEVDSNEYRELVFELKIHNDNGNITEHEVILHNFNIN